MNTLRSTRLGPRSAIFALTFLLTGLVSISFPAPAAATETGEKPVFGQGLTPFGSAAVGDPVSLRGYASLTSVPPGGSIKIAVGLEIQPRWHVNANRVLDDFLIPTKIAFETPPGMTVKETVYPPPEKKKLSFSDKPLLLFEGRVHVGALVDVRPGFAVGDTAVTAVVTYQACNDIQCLAPVDKRIRIPVKISPPTAALDAAHPEIFAAIRFSGEPGSDKTAGAAMAGSGRLGALIARHGYFVAFFAVFLWGLALNLTPCVYPIIPITVGYFGGQSSGRTSRTAFLAIVYVLGMAAMYSSLGVAAALTGGILGGALQNPVVISFVALVLVGLSLSMFGFYEIRVPARLSNFAGTSKQGAVGAFLMGLTVGIVAAPCIGPFVLALLTFVGESGNPLLGFSMFFTLALGLGLPFVFLAVLSGSISRLPKSGEWMEWVKKLFGVILLAMAIFFLQPLIGDPVYFGLLGLLFVVAGVLLGFVKKTSTTALFFVVFKRFVGIAAPLFGLYLLLAPGHIIARGGSGVGIAWRPFDADLLAEAKRNNQLVMIDFYADWCLPCKELDHRTFSRREVVVATNDILPLKADLTQIAAPDVAKLRKDFEIRGVPTVVFITGGGKEREDLRVFGFVDHNEFIRRVEALKTGRTAGGNKS